MKSFCALIVVLGLLLCEAGFAAAASVEERLDQVNRMPEKVEPRRSKRKRARKASWFGTRPWPAIGRPS